MNGVDRKRVPPHLDADVGSTAAPGGPPVKKARFAPPAAAEDRDNGLEVDQDLENFRKEAIWREMQEYRRKFERAEQTIERLDSERKRCEARLSAVDLSWNLLVKEADLLLPSTSTSNGHSQHAATSPAVSDPDLNDEELEEALAQRSTATKALLRRLEALHPSESNGGSAKVDELQETCRTLAEQSMRTAEALRLLRATHEASLAQLTDTVAELARAEKRLDRLQSRTVATIEGRSISSPLERTASNDRPMTNGSHPSPSTSVAPVETSAPQPAGGHVEELRVLADSRAREVDELRNARVALKLELDAAYAKINAMSLSEEIVMDSVPFKVLQGHVQYLTAEYEARRVELEKAVTEADLYRETQISFKELVFKEAGEQVDEIQRRLLTKETDLTRIRTQREELRAEATELRARENEKVRNLDQLKTLAQSREDRIVAYSSEVRRLKMQIAAAQGDSATVDLYANHEESDIVSDLQNRLKTAESLLLALRDQLQSYASNRGNLDVSTITKSETDARLELSSCRERLAKLEALLGPQGEVELKELANKLDTSEARLKVLEAQTKSSEHEKNMLYGEIDRLSTAWSTLDEQNNAKVFNLVTLEEKVQRLNAEKAKADNRYFATMRQKDAIAAENAVFTRLAEKQQRAVETAKDATHSLGTQLSAQEKEISGHQRNVRAHQESLASIRRENAELNLRNEQNAKTLSELNQLLEMRVREAESEHAARKQTEVDFAQAKRELQSSSTTVVSGSSDSAQLRELQSYNDDLSAMLKCSTCKIRFKGVIINRCGHLFCKECIDARLSNRQRKCPSCGIAFGKDDVSPVFF